LALPGWQLLLGTDDFTTGAHQAGHKSNQKEDRWQSNDEPANDQIANRKLAP